MLGLLRSNELDNVVCPASSTTATTWDVDETLLRKFCKDHNSRDPAACCMLQVHRHSSDLSPMFLDIHIPFAGGEGDPAMHAAHDPTAEKLIVLRVQLHSFRILILILILILMQRTGSPSAHPHSINLRQAHAYTCPTSHRSGKLVPSNPSLSPPGTACEKIGPPGIPIPYNPKYTFGPWFPAGWV
jgi:hypothetical protein